jgi:hypothetical protein
MAVLSWGKPRIFIQKEGETKWKELPTPVEDSTQLATTKGDKKEAKVEGGENEDVKFAKNTYALNLNIRQAKGRVKPIVDADGVINDNYKVVLQPEDPTNEGFCLDKTTVSVEDTWTSADGGIWAYAFDALKPESGDQVKWGEVSVTGTADNLEVTFTPSNEE